MVKITLFEDDKFVNFLPLVYWRTMFELRLGRKILLDRTAQRVQSPITGVWTRDWIARVAEQRCCVPANTAVDASTVLINGRWLLDGPLDWPAAPCVGMIDSQVAYIVCDDSLAQSLTPTTLLEPKRRSEALQGIPTENVPGRMLQYPWDLVFGITDSLADDWQDFDAGIEVDLDPRVIVAPKERVHIGQRCAIHPTAVIAADEGPVFIGEDVRVGPYVVIEGPAYIGAGSIINAHARLHGGCAIGPVCKVGGEIDGCVIQGYSNKQHEGFLGHCYVGSWVNLGAGTVNSDLKNTYGRIRVPINGMPIDTDRTMFGAVIGDHVKTAINTAIPTGAVIGMASMVASSGFVPKFVPSFRWLTDGEMTRGDVNRLLDCAVTVMARRNVEMTDVEVELFLDLGDRVRGYEPSS